MKKIFSLMCIALFVICNASSKTKIVTTIFPEYDWVRNITGADNPDIELTLLLDKGTDLHSFQPSVKDMAKVSSCDMFIYAGGESDKWAEGILKSAKNKNMITVNLLESLGSMAKEEEAVEGMECEEEEDEGEEAEYDEHVWLSLKNASFLCSVITDKLCTLNPSKSETYRANLKNYTQELNRIDEEYRQYTDKCSQKTVIFGDRFPFRYLFDDYSLNYYAAFMGCSAETEASFKTILFLAKKTDELGLDKIAVIDNSNNKIAETIIANTKNKNQKIVMIDSMQSVTAADIKKGTTYTGIMKNNLNAIKMCIK